MKKRFFRFLLGILYIGLMIALLVVYVQNIAGRMERMFAIIGTLALSASAVIILILYIRLKNQEEAKEKARNKTNESAFFKEGWLSAKDTSPAEHTSPGADSPAGLSTPEPDKAHTERIETKAFAILQIEELEERLRPFALSKRETEVAWLLYRGYTNRQIAEELYIAETTVKKHATHIYEKMQVSGRKEYKEKLKNVP